MQLGREAKQSASSSAKMRLRLAKPQLSP